MLISRMDVSGKPSFSLSIFTFFRATMRPFALSLALMAHKVGVRDQGVAALRSRVLETYASRKV